MSEEPATDRAASRVPFFYGWVMLPVVFVIQAATSPGQTFGVSIFNPYIREALSLSQSQISGAYTLGTLLASIPMAYVGSLMDRFGARRVLAFVALLFGLACAGISQATGLATVFLSFLFLRMLGQGAMSMLASNTLAMWFHARLGFASGLVSVCSALFMGMVPTLSLLLIHAAGWRWAYAILGALVVCIVLPLLALVYRNRPEDAGEIPDGMAAVARRKRPPPQERSFTLPQAVRTRSFWIIGVASAMPAMMVTGIHFHAVQIFLDRGLTEADAAGMFTTFSLAFSAVILVGGYLADRLPLNLLLAAAMMGLAAGMGILGGVTASWAAVAFAVVLGGAQGIHVAVRSTIWVRYYGRPHLGKIRGSLVTLEVAASSAGPLLMGAAHDYFGSYTEVLSVFVLAASPMALLSFLATAPRMAEPDAETAR